MYSVTVQLVAQSFREESIVDSMGSGQYQYNSTKSGFLIKIECVLPQTMLVLGGILLLLQMIWYVFQDFQLWPTGLDLPILDASRLPVFQVVCHSLFA